MRKNGVKERIVETALRLFYQQGYNATGITQIIKEAEIARFSLFYNFPSKEDLLTECLRVAADRTNEGLGNAISKQTEPIEKINAMFDVLCDVVQGKSYNGCRFLNIISEMPVSSTEIRAQVKRQKDHIRNLFSDILKPINKENLADTIYLLFDGALIANKVQNDVWPVELAKQTAKQLINA